MRLTTVVPTGGRRPRSVLYSGLSGPVTSDVAPVPCRFSYRVPCPYTPLAFFSPQSPHRTVLQVHVRKLHEPPKKPWPTCRSSSQTLRMSLHCAISFRHRLGVTHHIALRATRRAFPFRSHSLALIFSHSLFQTAFLATNPRGPRQPTSSHCSVSFRQCFAVTHHFTPCATTRVFLSSVFSRLI